MEMNREHLNQLMIKESDINDLMGLTITIWCTVENKTNV